MQLILWGGGVDAATLMKKVRHTSSSWISKFSSVTAIHTPKNFGLPKGWKCRPALPTLTIEEVVRQNKGDDDRVVVAPLGTSFYGQAYERILQASNEACLVTWEWSEKGVDILQPTLGYKKAIFCWIDGASEKPPRHLPEVLCSV